MTSLDLDDLCLCPKLPGYLQAGSRRWGIENGMGARWTQKAWVLAVPLAVLGGGF